MSHQHIVFILDIFVVRRLLEAMVERMGYVHVYRTVGRTIAEMRRVRGRRLTQQQLADRTGGEISRSAVANIESGRQRLAIHHLYLIARGLDIEPAQLLPPVKDIFPQQDESLEQELAKDPKLAKWLSKVVRKPITAGL